MDMRRGIATLFGALLAAIILQVNSQYCRDCALNACLPVAKAEGGCDACICDGLLMPDCEKLNCSSNCVEEQLFDGCWECVCTDPLANVCPPIPPCPSRCQMKLGSGCPLCTCPDEATEQPCPEVSCPPQCRDVIGEDGCLTCECPPPDVVCPQMPACPLGCISESVEPGYSGCLDCNCTIIEELLSENQIIPLDEIEDAIDEVELISGTIDPGLVIPTEVYDRDAVGDDQNSLNPIDPLDPSVLDIIPVEELAPDLPPPEYVDTTLPEIPDTITTSPENNQASRNPSNPSRNPELRPAPNQPSRPQPPPPGRRPNNRPQVNIPCGETSCPAGCILCIQGDNCGRCLCGENARICPAVPACPPDCISAGRDGCFRCSCSSRLPGNIFPNLPELPPIPELPFPGIEISSGESFLGGGPQITLVRIPPRGPPMRHIQGPGHSPGFHGQIPFEVFPQGPPPGSPGYRGPAPGTLGDQGSPNSAPGSQNPLSGTSGSRGPNNPNQIPNSGSQNPGRPQTFSPGFLTIQRIPTELLGQSRFHRVPQI